MRDPPSSSKFVQESFHREGKAIGIFMAASNHFAAEHPDVDRGAEAVSCVRIPRSGDAQGKA